MVESGRKASRGWYAASASPPFGAYSECRSAHSPHSASVLPSAISPADHSHRLGILVCMCVCACVCVWIYVSACVVCVG